MRMATGTSTRAATSDSPRLPSRRSSSGNRDHFCGRGALVGDHVVDRAIDLVARVPAGGGVERRRDRLAVRDLFEARLVGDLERDVANLGAGAGALDHALGELLDADLLGG